MSAIRYVESSDGIIMNWEVNGMSTCGLIKIPLTRDLPLGVEERYIITSQGKRCLYCNWTRLPSKYKSVLSPSHV